MHNLDTCEVTVVGEELNQEQETLEVDMARLQQKGMEMSSSNLGMIITGNALLAFFAFPAQLRAEREPRLHVQSGRSLGFHWPV